MMLIPLIIIAALVYFWLNSQDRGDFLNHSKHDEDALDILNKRFARGEISEEEYIKIKSMI